MYSSGQCGFLEGIEVQQKLHGLTVGQLAGINS